MVNSPSRPGELYRTLGVEPGSSPEDLRKAFLRKAARVHPDKAPASQKEQATESFQRLSQAFAVLSDTEKRQEYDRSQQAQASVSGQFSRGEATGAQGHDAFAAMQNLFDECFNSSFPAWSAFGGSAFGGFGDPFQRMDAFARASDDLFASYPFSAGRPRGGEGADTELPLSLTLEEMAAGGPKQLSYSRNIADGVSGELLTVEELATVQLAPGVREGTRVVLKNRGDEARGRGCGDLILVIHEALHPRFQRKGDDLYTRVDVPLLAALTSDHVMVPLLDGRALRVPVSGPVTPETRVRLPGRGMPVPQEGSAAQQGGGRRCGDLYCSFRVVFPRALSPQQKASLQAALGQ